MLASPGEHAIWLWETAIAHPPVQSRAALVSQVLNVWFGQECERITRNRAGLLSRRTIRSARCCVGLRDCVFHNARIAEKYTRPQATRTTRDSGSKRLLIERADLRNRLSHYRLILTNSGHC